MKKSDMVLRNLNGFRFTGALILQSPFISRSKFSIGDLCPRGGLVTDCEILFDFFDVLDQERKVDIRRSKISGEVTGNIPGKLCFTRL